MRNRYTNCQKRIKIQDFIRKELNILSPNQKLAQNGQPLKEMKSSKVVTMVSEKLV